jgi:hypothetical protein
MIRQGKYQLAFEGVLKDCRRDCYVLKPVQYESRTKAKYICHTQVWLAGNRGGQPCLPKASYAKN